MTIAVITSSLKNESLSRKAAKEAIRYFKSKQVDIVEVDLRDYPLPFCDGESAYHDANCVVLKATLEKCKAYLIATPVYNFDVNSVLKNMTELMGGVMENKLAGFICAAGGAGSFMSVMAYANSLMLDFRCWIVPRFVYVTAKNFDTAGHLEESVTKRIHELCDVMRKKTSLSDM